MFFVLLLTKRITAVRRITDNPAIKIEISGLDFNSILAVFPLKINALQKYGFGE